MKKLISLVTTLLLTMQTIPTLAQNARDVCEARKIPQLTNVLDRTGIKFVHTSAPEKKYIVESMSGGVLLIDFDQDGWLDVYFTNAPTVEMALKDQRSRSSLYKNNRDGTFTDVTDKAGVAFPGYAMGGAVADFNNDGWPDMYITCLGGNTLYRNNGDGTFADVTKQAGVSDGRWSAGAAFADYDNDGFLDLYVANYVDFKMNDLPVFGSLPTCKFRGVDVQCGPRGLKGAGDSLYRNNGNGTFTDVSKPLNVHDPNGYYGMQPVWSSFGNNGFQDVYVANDSTANFLYKNDGKAKFAEVGLESGTAVSGDGSEQGSMGVTIGDYLHTGNLAIFTTNFVDEYNTLYRNDGGHSFTDVSFSAKVAQTSRPLVGWGTGFFDLDNDTWLDLFVVNGHVYPQMDSIASGARYKQPKLLHINLGNGSFCEASTLAGKALQEPRVSRGAAFGDIDNDGDIDIIVGELDGVPMFLRNEGEKANNWISLELSAIKGSPLAIGARVKITTGGVSQVSEIRSGDSYLSQSDFRQHFGLAKASKVDSVEIRWPSGKVETIKDLAANKRYAIKEDSGVVDAERIRPKKTSN